MKIDINATEQKMLVTAIEQKQASLQRARNAETNVEVQDIRDKEIATYKNLAAKLMTGELTK